MLTIANQTFRSRLFLGTGKFASPDLMRQAVEASATELVTLALRRVELTAAATDDLVAPLEKAGVRLLPNTSGARTAEEAILAAELGREALATNWLKLEIHPDPRYLMPDPIETLRAAEELVRRGFIVLPYVQADPVLCKRLEEVGCAAVMPLAAPIGSNRGLDTRALLRIIIAESLVPVIIDAGIGTPSQAAACMEMGADAVLVNTAIATSSDPVGMACAFFLGVEAGRLAYEARLAPVRREAEGSSPLTSFLFTSDEARAK